MPTFVSGFNYRELHKLLVRVTSVFRASDYAFSRTTSLHQAAERDRQLAVAILARIGPRACAWPSVDDCNNPGSSSSVHCSQMYMTEDCHACWSEPSVYPDNDPRLR